MKYLVTLATILIVLHLPGKLRADDLNKVYKTEIHDNFISSITTNFVEDVYALLPLDMKEYLKRDYKLLESSSKINYRHNYWNKGVISKQHFSIVCKNTKITTSTQLAKDLGAMVGDIFEVAMSIDNDDPFAKGLQNNIISMMKNSNEFKYEIKYRGYDNQTIDSIVERIYLLKHNRNKIVIFPDIITLTADMWSAIWVANGNKPVIEAKLLVRSPGFLDVMESAIDTKKTPKVPTKTRHATAQDNRSEYLKEQRRARLERLERLQRLRMLQDVESRRFNSYGNPSY